MIVYHRQAIDISALAMTRMELHPEGVSIAVLQQDVGESRRAREIANRMEAEHNAELSAMQKMFSSLSNAPG